MQGTLSPADVAVLSGNSGNGNNCGFGEGYGSWWIIIFLIFAFMGWGRNGNGFGGNSGSGAADNYVLASDFAQLSRQLDSGFDHISSGISNVNNGLCDGFFNVNTSFGNLNTTLCQAFGNTNNMITQNGYETRLGINSLGSQLANCCCDIRQQIADCCCTTQRGIDGINYNMAMNANTLQNAMCLNTRDIVDAVNSSYRNLHEEIVANRIEDKNAQITAQQNEINALRLAASQERQNAYLLNELKPCPSAAYIVPNPNCCYNYTVTSNGCGGCGSNFM